MEEVEDDDSFNFPEQPSDGDGNGGSEDDFFSGSPFASGRDLSFAASTATSSSSFSSSSGAESLHGFWVYPPISEYEEIPSLRWLSPPQSRRNTSTRMMGGGRLLPSAYPSAPAGSADHWEEPLPPDIKGILSRAVVPVRYSSWEDLYVRLCSSILIDDGNKCFALDRSTGKKCYLLSASDLRITWEDEGWCSLNFKWTSLPQSRFSRVARLATVWWSGIHAEIDARELSPETTYIACLVFGYSGRAFGDGLNSESQDATISVGALTFKRSSVFLQPNEQQRRRAGARVPRRRGDGLLELEMGEFTTTRSTTNSTGAMEEEEEEEEEEKEMTMVRVSLERREVRHDDESILGLVVEGVELRPRPPPRPTLRGLWQRTRGGRARPPLRREKGRLSGPEPSVPKKDIAHLH